jgi:hypothetical protein
VPDKPADNVFDSDLGALSAARKLESQNQCVVM